MASSICTQTRTGVFDKADGTNQFDERGPLFRLVLVLLVCRAVSQQWPGVVAARRERFEDRGQLKRERESGAALHDEQRAETHVVDILQNEFDQLQANLNVSRLHAETLLEDEIGAKRQARRNQGEPVIVPRLEVFEREAQCLFVRLNRTTGDGRRATTHELHSRQR
jgi:hypothetical protein